MSSVLSGASGAGAWLNYISNVYLWALSIMSCFIMIYPNQNSTGHEVLLLSFNTKLSFDDPGKKFHFTEVFSGQGAVSKRMQGAQSRIISFHSKIKCFFGLKHHVHIRSLWGMSLVAVPHPLTWNIRNHIWISSSRWAFWPSAPICLSFISDLCAAWNNVGRSKSAFRFISVYNSVGPPWHIPGWSSIRSWTRIGMGSHYGHQCAHLGACQHDRRPSVHM